MNTVGYMCSKYPVKIFYICSLSIKRFHPYFELLYFHHGKAVWSLKLSTSNVKITHRPSDKYINPKKAEIKMNNQVKVKINRNEWKWE